MQCKKNQSVAQDLWPSGVNFHIVAAALLSFGANVPKSTTFVKCVAQFEKCVAQLNNCSSAVGGEKNCQRIQVG